MSMSRAERNVRWIREHLSGSQHKVEESGEQLSVEQFDYFTEDTVFYYDRKTYRGKAGMQRFIALLEPYVLHLGEVIDIFGSDERVTMVLRERLERRRDGKVFDYVRTATYRIENNVMLECWIVDAPPEELAQFLDEG